MGEAGGWLSWLLPHPALVFQSERTRVCLSARVFRLWLHPFFNTASFILVLANSARWSAHARAHTRAHTHARTQTHMHAHTHTHTHTLFPAGAALGPWSLSRQVSQPPGGPRLQQHRRWPPRKLRASQSVLPLPGEEATGRGPERGAGRAGALRVQAEEVPAGAQDLLLQLLVPLHVREDLVQAGLPLLAPG